VAVKKEGQEAEHSSPWAFRIVVVNEIPIRVHFTFLLFLLWIALTSASAIQSVMLVLAIFGCVLLHELGHALTARKFGIETRDITLYPIGGVAMLTGRPRPRQELWIALAGPAVNLGIAGILFAALVISNGGIPTMASIVNGQTSLGVLLAANLSLAVFNMIPAFPMDGGRVLRAYLGLRMAEAKATYIAAIVGQGLSIIFGILGLVLGSPILMLIAFFVFLGAGQEVTTTRTRTFLQGRPIKDAMQSRFRWLEGGDSLDTAANALLAGSQRDFPVRTGDQVIGILTREDLAQGMAEAGPSAYVAGHMRRDVKTAHPNLPLEMALDMFTKDDMTPILLMEDDQVIGLVTADNLAEFVMLEHARREGRKTYAYPA